MNTLWVALFLLVSSGLLFGQETRIELGDKLFDQYAYGKAIELYKEAKDRDKNNWEIYLKLGDCYYYTSKINDAIDHYKIALENTTFNTDQYRLKYALSMLSNNNDCSEVIGTLENEKNGSLTIDVIAKYFGLEEELKNDRKNIGEKICQRRETSSSENIEHLDINTNFSDFGSFIFNGILYFSSSRKQENNRKHNKKRYKWNEHPYLDIYEAKIIKDSDSINSMLVPQEISKIGINTVAHEAGIAITKDGKYMYYSGGEVLEHNKNKLKYNKRGTSTLKLKRATWNTITNKWEETIKDKNELGTLNLENYSVGNPALTPDNKWLLFVSCAPYADAQGKTDIYYVKIEKEYVEKINDIVINDTIIKYGKPKNLSQAINTSGRESFPFISKDSTLYFSSDGVYNKKRGSGLLDIYKVNNIYKLIELRELDKDIDSLEVINLGTPYNSPMDDFAYFIEEPKDENDCGEIYAYFSSNREVTNDKKDEKKGYDDIYKVKVKRTRTIQGTIKHSISGNNLDDATVELIDADGTVKYTVKTDATGTFSFDEYCNEDYTLRGSKDRYYDALTSINSAEAKDNIELELKPYPCLVTINYEGFESLNQIEFEFNIDSIGENEKNTLLKLRDLLVANRDMKIKIESHTDSRGSDEDNINLSTRRAVNTKSFLIQADVNESQIESAIGYGEGRLCFTDEEIQNMPIEKREAAHQKNRRSHFIIVGCEDNTPNCPDND